MIDLKFEPEAIQALNIMENTKFSLYLTWKAWAWKSTLINFFIENTKKRFLLLWTTWISAINIQGQTIHRFFGIIPDEKHCYMNSSNINILRKTDIFIIDEVSMMRSDLFDLIDKKLKIFMQNELPFGWKQIVFVWDLFQLPPVPEKDNEEFNKKYKWLFFFNWNNFNIKTIKIIELKKIYRQTDLEFIKNLNLLRIWYKNKKILDYFNKKVISEKEINPKSILIWTTNKIVDIKNSKELNNLPWEEKVSVAYISWDYPTENQSVEKVLRLKIWARIMFVINDKNDDYVNWTLWTVLQIKTNSQWFISEVKIETDDWHILDILKYTWIRYWDEIDVFTWERKIEWKFIQFPFKLAFAITIHKVQWKTFNNVVIDLWWGAFAEWQVYVALSRCTSYEWLQLLKPIKEKDIKTSKEVINFMKKI